MGKKKKSSEGNLGISRRQFLKNTSAAAAGFMIVPRHVLGGAGYRAPSDTVNLGLIGAGAQGMSNITDPVVSAHNLVALADIDHQFVWSQLEEERTGNDEVPNLEGVQLYDAYSNATWYTDFRRMLEEQRDNIDGVFIATPDHGHAIQANVAMELGMAVYVQKPLTWSVKEARILNETAQRTGVITQMGNQGHSYDESKRVIEWIQGGVLGPVREVHAWTNRPTWPQGVPRPTKEVLNRQTGEPSIEQLLENDFGFRDISVAEDSDLQNWGVRSIQQPLAYAMNSGYSGPPTGIDWDLFIGPAPMVPYHPIYHPFNWRGWVDWGIGALGDMGAHLLDQPFSALNLNLPDTISATSTPFGMDVDGTPATWPLAMTVHYTFPERGDQPRVKLHWYDGGLLPSHPDLLPPEITLEGNGVIYVGDRGILVTGNRGVEPHLFYPESLREDADAVPQTLARVPDGHILNFVNAIQGTAEPSSTFDFAVPLTETMLLGLVAARVGQGRTLQYDAENMSITNYPEADILLTREYRRGWTL